MFDAVTSKEFQEFKEGALEFNTFKVICEKFFRFSYSQISWYYWSWKLTQAFKTKSTWEMEGYTKIFDRSWFCEFITL